LKLNLKNERELELKLVS